MPWCSAGRSRTSWIDRAATMTRTSEAQPRRSASNSMRPRRGSIGRRARSRPMPVSLYWDEAGAASGCSASRAVGAVPEAS